MLLKNFELALSKARNYEIQQKRTKLLSNIINIVDNTNNEVRVAPGRL
jgi:hypothetical protein